MEKNFYDILELNDEQKQLQGDAFEKVLKANYRKLSRQYHPDKFSTKSEKEQKEAEEKFKEISEAYNTLSDPQKRQQYDFSTMGMGGGGFDPFAGFNPFDIFGSGRQNQRPRTYKGKDIQMQIEVSLEEVLNGGEREIEYEKLVNCGHCNGTGSADGKTNTCPHCNGTGMVTEMRQQGNMRMMSSHPCPHCKGSGKTISKPCPHCNGKGMKGEKVREKINIPKGVIDGQWISLEGKGYGLPNGVNGINGDLIVIFSRAEHDIFTTEGGADLYAWLEVDLFDALLGCEKTFTCLDGKTVNIKVPELTKSGKMFDITGKGLPYHSNPNIYGKLILTVKYKMPNKLTNKQRELLKKIKE